MQSALLFDPWNRSNTSEEGSANSTGANSGSDSLVAASTDVFDLTGFGVSGIDSQSPHERAYSPRPTPTGDLIHDPDFTLPTIAGPLSWRLYHYSSEPNVRGPFGYGRRASWPLRLCAEQDPPEGSIVTVMLEREDGLGVTFVSNNGGSSYTPKTPRIFDDLQGNISTGFIYTYRDSGTAYHYPAGNFVSLSYYETVHGAQVSFSYDEHSRLQYITDPASRQIEYRYNEQGFVSEVEDWAGRIHTLSYVNHTGCGVTSGDLHTIHDPAGYLTTFGYDTNHRLTSILPPNGWTTSYDYYDGINRVKQRTVGGYASYYDYVEGNDFGGRTVRYRDPYPDHNPWTTEMDALGNVRRVTDPVNAVRTASYDTHGLPTAIIDAVGRITTIVYDSTTGREVTHQEPSQAPNYYDVDDFGNVTRHTDPLGRVTTYQYDDPESRLLNWVKDPLGHVTTYGYTSWGALKSVETPLGAITTYTWDDLYGVLLEQTNPLNGTRVYTYDTAGNRLTETDEEGRVTTYSYDALGRQISSKNGVGAVRTTLYDGVGDLIISIDPLGHATTYSYNAFHEVIDEWDANGQHHLTGYDRKGREISRTDPNGNTTTNVYDPADRLIARKDAMERATSTSYDPARRPISVMDPAGVVYRTEYDLIDAASQLPAMAQIAPAGQRTTSVYDQAGYLVATIDTTGSRTSFLYDPVGRLNARIEPTGARTTTVYDADGRAINTIDAYGAITTSCYDAAGYLRVSIDPEGKRYTTTYDQSGLRLAEYAPDGTSLLRHYDEAGRSIQTTDHLGKTTFTGYDLANQVISFTDEYNKTVRDHYDPVGLSYLTIDTLGNVYTTIYDDARRPYRFHDSTGNITTTSYDITNRVTAYKTGIHADDETEFYHYHPVTGRYVAFENGVGDRTTTVYDEHGRVRNLIAGDGHATTYIYDDYGRWAALTDAEGHTVTTIFDDYSRSSGYIDQNGKSTTLTLDLLDRTIAHTNPKGAVTSFSYDKLGRLHKHIDAKGAVTTHLYDEVTGNIAARINAQGQITSFHYDDHGRLQRTIDPKGQITTTTYNGFGQVETYVSPRGLTTTLNYDEWGRSSAFVNARGYWTTTIYDDFGRVAGSTDPKLHTTRVHFDLRNRVIGHEDGKGKITSTAYDKANRVAATTNPMGYSTSINYDRVGRTLEHIDAKGNRTTYSYNRRGDQIAVKDARGLVTSYGYDGRGSQRTIIDATGSIWTNVYDDWGQLINFIDPHSNVTTTVYDEIGRIIAHHDASGGIVSNVYDSLGQLIATVNPNGNITTNSYDSLGRVVTQMDARNEIWANVYDANGNQIAAINPHGHITSYAFDELDRSIARTDPKGRVHTTTFDEAGRRLTHIDAKGQITTFTHDERNMEILRVHADGQQFSYTYDDAGQRIAVQDLVGLSFYTFDRVGQILTASGDHSKAPISYAYDSVGNRIGQSSSAGLTTYSYNSLNQLHVQISPGIDSHSLAGDITTFGYDERGLRTSQLRLDGSLTTFGYDPAGRKTEINHVDSDGHLLDYANYTYDAAGRPTHKYTLPRVMYQYVGGSDSEDFLGSSTAFLPIARTRDISFTDTGVQAGVDYTYRITALTAVGESNSSLGQLVTPQWQGLLGEYFSNATLSTEVLTRLDPVIDFNWGGGSPDPSVPTDNFSARWIGKVVPRYSEVYTFVLNADDGVRLYINNNISPILDHWTSGGAGLTSSPVTLTADTEYDIKLEYQEGSGNASVSLFWHSSSQATEIVPSSRLKPADPSATAVPPAPSALQAKAISGGQIDLQWSLFERNADNSIQIERAPYGAGALSWASIANLDGDALAYSDTDSALVGGNPYIYRLRLTRPTSVSSGYCSPALVTLLPAGDNNAVFVAQEMPVYMKAGTTQIARLTLRNTGTATWTAADGYELVWRGSGTSPWSVSTVALPVDSVAPGEEVQFLIDVVAPLTASTAPGYDYKWSMEQTGVGTFGAVSPDVYVTVDSATLGSGLIGTYFSFGGKYLVDPLPSLPAFSQLDSNVNFTWSGSPGGSLTSDYFGVRWTGKVVPATSDSYTFIVATDDGIRLWVDGNLLIDKWAFGSAGTPFTSTSVPLTANTEHDIILEYNQQTGGAFISLSWQGTSVTQQVIPSTCLRPTPGNPPFPAGPDPVTAVVSALTAVEKPGVLGYYYPNTTLSFPYTGITADPMIWFGWGTTSPISGIPASSSYSIRWVGKITPLYSEDYIFTLQHFGNVKLWIDGNVKIDEMTGTNTYNQTGTISMQAGVPASFQLDFVLDLTVWPIGANIGLAWQSDTSQAFGPIPPSCLSLPPDADAYLIPSVTLNQGDLHNVVSWHKDPSAVAYLIERSVHDTNNLGNLGDVVVVIDDGIVNYEYDEVDQLTVESSSKALTTYTYDASGRRISKALTNYDDQFGLYSDAFTSYSYDPADQLLASQNISVSTTFDRAYVYDENGSRISEQLSLLGDSSGPRETLYAWDAAKRLKSVQLSDSNRHTYTYAEDGLRHEHILPGGSESLFWDRARNLSVPLSWHGDSGVVSQLYQSFIHEPTSDPATPHLLRAVGITQEGFAANWQFYMDAQGTPGLATNVNGDNRTTFTFEAWGNDLSPAPTPDVVTVTDDAFGYIAGQGYWQEDDLGLAYVRQRWYDPQSGQWLSVDPVDTEPRYNYANNSPTINVDANGTSNETPADALKGTVAVCTALGIQINLGDERLVEATKISANVHAGKYGYLLLRDSKHECYYLAPRDTKIEYIAQFATLPSSHVLGQGKWYHYTDIDTGIFIDFLLEKRIIIYDTDENPVTEDDYRLIPAIQSLVKKHTFLADGYYHLLKLGSEYVFSQITSGTIYARGYAGAIIDKWFFNELRSQVAGFDDWRNVRNKVYLFKATDSQRSMNWNPRNEKGQLNKDADINILPQVSSRNGRPSPVEMLDWANGNEFYKDPDIFPFNPIGFKNIANTAPGTIFGGDATVTLFNHFVPRDKLGNLMYGAVAKYLGWFSSVTELAPVSAKYAGKFKHFIKRENIDAPIDPHDQEAYALGWDMMLELQRHGYFVDSKYKHFNAPDENIRAAFNTALAKNQGALKENIKITVYKDQPNERSYNFVVDYRKLQSPMVETDLHYHGGWMGAISAPIVPTGENAQKVFERYREFWHMPSK